MLRGIESSTHENLADAMSELTAEAFAFDFELYIGPTWDYWPTNLSFNWNKALPTETTLSTVLSASISDFPDVIPVQSTASFPDEGLLFIAPTSASQHWDAVAYGSTTGSSFTSASWLDSSEGLTGEHGSGASVFVFAPATNYLKGSISVDGSLQDHIFSWRATVNLDNIPKRLIKRDYSVAVARRKLINGAWGSEHLWFLGFIDSVKIKKDYVDRANVTLTIRGLTSRLEKEKVKAFARGQNRQGWSNGRFLARTSSELSNPLLEADSDDFLIGEPLSAGTTNAVDGDLNTVWIAEGIPSNISWETPTSTAPGCIDEVFPSPWVGFGPEYQWFRIFIGETTKVGQIRIENQDGKVLDLSDSNMHDEVIAEKPVILCYNKTAFLSMFDPGNVPVIEWSALHGESQGARDFQLGTDFGWLHMRKLPWGFNDGVVWGNGSGNPPEASYGFWSGPWVKPPARGHSVRRFPSGKDTDTSADWIEESIPAPGEYGGKPSADSSAVEWISVDLGEVEWTLGQNLTADPNDPTDRQINVKIGTDDNTDGLDRKGFILVGSELIAYNGKTKSHILNIQRGVLGTNPTAHGSGSEIMQWEAGRAYRTRKISTVAFIRKAGRWPIPYYCRAFYSVYNNPRFPGTDNWNLDWALAKTWNRDEKFWKVIRFGEGKRIRHIMLIIDQMGSRVGSLRDDVASGATSIELDTNRWFSKMPSTGYVMIGSTRVAYTKGTGNSLTLGSGIPATPAGTSVFYLGGRARLNEVMAQETNLMQEGGDSSSPSDEPTDLIYDILVNKFGLLSSWLRYIKANIPILEEYVITAQPYKSILNDLCKRFGLFLIELPDGKFNLIPDPWYARDLTQDLEIRYDWGRNNSLVSELQFVSRPVVRKVSVTVQDPVQGKTETFTHPPDLSGTTTGATEDIGEITAPLENGPWIAAREFARRRASRKWSIEPVGLIDHVWGLQVHNISWGDMNGTGLVTSISVSEGPADYSAKIMLQEFRVS